MAKFSLEEKRLQQLRTQLSGSGNSRKKESVISPSHSPIESITSSTHPLTAEARFMKQDLLKIAALTTVALLVQFGLYAAMVSKIIPVL